MSDVAATNCGGGCSCGGGSNNNCLIIILLLLCCGGCGGFNGGCGDRRHDQYGFPLVLPAL